MLRNGSFVFIKQKTHLSLCKPNSLLFEANINFNASFVILVYEYFAVIHATVSYLRKPVIPFLLSSTYL